MEQINQTVVISATEIVEEDQFLLSFFQLQPENKVYDGIVPIHLINRIGEKIKFHLTNVTSTGNTLVAELPQDEYERYIRQIK